MSSSTKKVLTIIGGTGNQGGSIITTALSHPELSSKYTLRTITRNPDSKKAQALAAQGVELVKGDLDDAASLRAAFDGSHGVFGVTDFWSHNSKTKEVANGKALFDAAKAAGVKHFIWSALPHVSKLSDGKYTHVDHFDGKAEVREYIEQNKPSGMWTTFVMPAMFLEQVKGMIFPVPGVGPALALPFPDDKVEWPLFSPSKDNGAYVMGVFESGQKADNAVVQAVSDWTTPAAAVEAVSRAAGKEVKFVTPTGEQFKANLPAPIAEDLTQMMLWMGEFGYYGPGAKERQSESDKWLLPGAKLLTWDAFVQGEQWQL
ncbi:hypothetical protein ANO11243_055650 [Dothideomycetidae sp. 11243]|nr:hypothetical protein ANO11243_055650 [fungal sp. No.11243]